MSILSDNSTIVLLVEGKDDVHVISKLLAKYNLSTLRDDNDKGINPRKINLHFCNKMTVPLDISPCEESDNDDKATATLKKFQAKIIDANSKIVGLVLDNDGSNRSIQIHEVICRVKKERKKKANIDICWKLEQNYNILTPGGFIAEPANLDTPRIGCWLMPDNKNSGMLETFLATLIPEKRHGLYGHAKEATQKAKKNFEAPYKDCHEDKATMHTYLAWQDEPGKPFGLAFDQRSFDYQNPHAKSFVDWIKTLFRPPTEREEPSSCQHPEL